jgi:hypothetical protein
MARDAPGFAVTGVERRGVEPIALIEHLHRFAVRGHHPPHRPRSSSPVAGEVAPHQERVKRPPGTVPTMAFMTARNLVFLCALVVAGCSSGGDPQAAPVTTTITSVRPGCVAIADNARALATEFRQLVAGTSDLDQVRAATNQLAGTIGDARAAAGPDARADFEEAGHALRRLQDSLNTQPVDWAGVHAAADELVAALRDVAGVCDAVPTS